MVEQPNGSLLSGLLGLELVAEAAQLRLIDPSTSERLLRVEEIEDARKREAEARKRAVAARKREAEARKRETEARRTAEQRLAEAEAELQRLRRGGRPAKRR